MSPASQKIVRLLNDGVAAHRRGAFPEAELAYRAVLKQAPRNADALHLLGQLLLHTGRVPDAVVALRAAVAARPGFLEAQSNLGNALRTLGDADALLVAADAGLAQSAGHPGFRAQRADAYFSLGRLTEGWQDRVLYEKSIRPLMAGKIGALPQWRGEDLRTSGLLIWADGSPGETAMMAGMIPDVLMLAQKCLIRCAPRMTALLRRSFPDAYVIDSDPSDADLSGIAFQSSWAGLAAMLRADPTQFPRRDSYLKADANRVSLLRQRYQRDDASRRLLVGIAWQSVGVDDAAGKSIGLGEWGPVLNVPGVTFVNLQYGNVSAALNVVRGPFNADIVEDPEINPLGALDAYADQVAAMDMVVSSSNTAIHFAGALGIPALCLIPQTPGRGRRWYWFAKGDEPLWYPRVRLLRQGVDGGWLRTLLEAGLSVLDAVQDAGMSADAATYLKGLARAFSDAGRLEDAERIYLRLEKEPGCAADAFMALGSLYKQAAQLERALSFFERAAKADPASYDALNMQGIVLKALHRPAAALASYHAALALHPDSAEMRNNAGTALRALGRSAEALAYYDESVRLNPAQHSVLLNKAAVLDDLNRFDESLAVLDELIAQRPDYSDARYNRALTLLTAERLAEGWPDFFWRLDRADVVARYEDYAVPRWNGESLAGKRLLIWTEQGLGDEILIAGMVPDAISAARSVTLVCSQRLVPLFRRSFPGSTVMARPLPSQSRPISGAFDVQMSFSDLGRMFRQSSSDFPRRESYLKPDAPRRQVLRAKYQALQPGTRLVGVSWRSINYEVGPLKGVTLMDLAPVLQTPGIQFVNLQYGDCSAELAAVRDATGVDVFQDPDVDPMRDMDAFAAQVAAMDLVISVSNTTVHVAGALGVPAWVLLPEGRGRLWYWFRGRSDSPWYASLRLLKQNAATQWRSVIEGVAAELREWVSVV